MKPENILVSITEEEVQRLAVEATVASQKGKLSKSLTATAPKHVVQKQTDSSMKMSRNKKKKMKQKMKKQLKKHQQEIDGGETHQQCDGDEKEHSGEEENTDPNTQNKEASLLTNGERRSSPPVQMETSSNNNGTCIVLTKCESMDTNESSAENSSRTREDKDNSSEPPLVENINGDVRMVSVDRNDKVTEHMDTTEQQQSELTDSNRSRVEERKERDSKTPEQQILENGLYANITPGVQSYSVQNTKSRRPSWSRKV